MENINIEFWRSAQDVQTNKQQWEDIYQASEASPYLSYEWFTTALKYFQGDNRLWIGIVKKGKRPIGIVPLEIAQERMGPLTLRVLRFALEGWSLQNGAIVVENMNELPVIEEVIRALRSLDTNWTYCRLSNFPISRLMKEERSKDRTTFLKGNIVIVGRSVMIEIPKTWNDYRKTLSNAHRKNLSRRLNDIERTGKVGFVRLGMNSVTDPVNLKNLMNDAEFVCKNSWQHFTPEGWAISDPKTGSFFSEVSEQLAAKGMLDLSVLYFNDRPISFIWGGARWPRTSINKLGFDKSYTKLSPGFVHLAKLVIDSIEKGVAEINFGHEFFDYKAAWGKRYDGICSIFYYPPGILPVVIRRLRSMRHSINIVEK